MLRTADKRLVLGERLTTIFGGRGERYYPSTKPPRIRGINVPPVSGYIAHYDPSDLGTVTLSGSVITALADKTGSFNSTGVNGSPLLLAMAGGYGLPAIFLNGFNSRVSSGASMSDITSSGFVVAQVMSASQSHALLGPNLDGGIEFRVDVTTSKITLDSADTAAIGDNDAAPVVVGTPFVAGYTLSATDCRVYNNLSGETDSGAFSLTGGRTLHIGDAPSVGAGGSRDMIGFIGEIVMYNTTLSDADAESVIGYLMSKWGIA